MLTAKKKLHLTSIFSLLWQVTSIVCGFILPRFFLETYGSAVNGLISSITQFLEIVALAECGVGAVIQSALYKPLAQKDSVVLSRIIVAAEHFFRTIAKLLIVYLFFLLIIYPKIIGDEFSYIFTASLIVIIAISSFAQYYFGIVYRLLLNSDQFGFVPIAVQIIALVLNLLLSIVLMKSGYSIHIVKLVSSIIFIVQPLIISFIAHRWYKIDRKVQITKDAIPQKWNGLAQHVAAVVLTSSGIFVLTIFSSLQNVSVYSIYFLVVNGIRRLSMSLTNGMQAFLGNLNANDDADSFKRQFETFEYKMHLFVTFIFSSTALLIVPFIQVYTKGITDVNYIEPSFGMMLSAAWGMYCIRLPYNSAVLAIGHYKQTQASAIIEVVINLVTSIILVLKFGLLGVAIGTFAAMFYRTCYLAWYISKKIINRSLWNFINLLLLDAFSILIYVSLVCLFIGDVCCFEMNFYWDWIVLVLKIIPIGVFSVGFEYILLRLSKKLFV